MAAKVESIFMSLAESVPVGRYVTHGVLVNRDGDEYLSGDLNTTGMRYLKEARQAAHELFGLAVCAGVRAWQAVRKAGTEDTPLGADLLSPAQGRLCVFHLAGRLRVAPHPEGHRRSLPRRSPLGPGEVLRSRQTPPR